MERRYILNAIDAALQAGEKILSNYDDPASDFQVEKKADNSPLTIADRKAHETICRFLADTPFPLLSEEGKHLPFSERRSWETLWIVDPLDGTKEFIKGNGEFTVNIALMYDNRPQIGVTYVPYINKIYFAVTGMGSYLKRDVAPDAASEQSYAAIFAGAERLPLTNQANEPLRIAVSRSHNTDETFEYITRIKQQYPSAVVIQQGSSYKFCMLAEGLVDVYVRTSPTSEWDTAAGEVILKEAGGRVEQLAGGPLNYNKESLKNPHFICKSPFWKD